MSHTTHVNASCHVVMHSCHTEYIYIHICMDIHIYRNALYIHMCRNAFIYIYTEMHSCIYIYMYSNALHMYTCRHACIYIYIYRNAFMSYRKICHQLEQHISCEAVIFDSQITATHVNESRRIICHQLE